MSSKEETAETSEDYLKGVWETLIYSIRLLKTFDREKTLKQLNQLKEDVEEGVAVDFVAKLTDS